MAKKILISCLLTVGFGAISLGAVASTDKSASSDAKTSAPVLTNKNAVAPASETSQNADSCFTNEAFKPGVYLGLSAGYGMTNWDLIDDANAVNPNNGNSQTKYDVKGTDNFAGRIYAGYDFHKNFALEVGYTQFFNDTDVKYADTNQEAFNPSYDWAIDAMAKIKAHIVDNFGFYAKVGIDYISVSESIDGKPHDSINLAYGAGAYYDFTPHVALDLSWIRLNGNSKEDDDTYIPYHDLFTAGIIYKFDLA